MNIIETTRGPIDVSPPHPRAKLTPEEREEAARLVVDEGLSVYRVAKHFGVSKATINYHVERLRGRRALEGVGTD